MPSIEEKRRAPLRRRLRRVVVARVILGVAWVLGVLPFALAKRLGRVGADLAFRFGKSDVARALEHLALAFPELDVAARTQLLRESYRHLGLTAIEAFQFRRLDRRLEEFVRFTPRALETISKVNSGKNGVVAFTGHLGSWEQLARRYGRHLPGRASAVAAEMLYPALGRWAESYRAAGDVKTFWRGRPGVREEMTAWLRAGGTLGLLVDQDTASRHVFVPFFGKLAATPRGGAEFVLDTGAAPIVIWDRRLPDGTHELDAFPLEFSPTGEREADVAALMAAATKALEDAIRKAPEQWVWAHRRWKTRPPGQA